MEGESEKVKKSDKKKIDKERVRKIIWNESKPVRKM
jgi:hypothetical protein